MRRQETWLQLADRLGEDRATVVAVCVFLNLAWPFGRIVRELSVNESLVLKIQAGANPLLRKTRRSRIEKTGVCTYCGTTHEITKDHVIPRSRGGSNDASNIVWACRNCNSAKGNRTPAEWLG